MKFKNNDYFYAVFRIVVGLMFATHGAQKLLGWFGGINGGSVPLFSLFGVAGVIEFVGGLFIALGLFTRIAAVVASLEMIVAYFRVHIPNGLVPLLNAGEPAVLFFLAFLVIMTMGAKKWSLEKALLKKDKY